jgi:hypothetical protein
MLAVGHIHDEMQGGLIALCGDFIFYGARMQMREIVCLLAALKGSPFHFF